jgi:hypothetical protein
MSHITFKVYNFGKVHTAIITATNVHIGVYDARSGRSYVVKRNGDEIHYTTFTIDQWRKSVESIWGRDV